MAWTRSRAKREPSRRGPGRQGARSPVWRTLLLVIAIAAAFFGIGYVMAVFVLFPREEIVERGIPVPDLVGLSADAARADIRRLGLEVADVRPIRTPDEPPGIVVAQSPIAGQHLLPGATVSIGVSAGAPSVVLPNLVGMSIHSAGQLLGALGVEISSRQEYAEGPLGRVLRTVPAAGETLSNPPRVLLIVSRGPEPRPFGGDSTGILP